METPTHPSVPPELEAVVQQLRAAVPDPDALELDGLKRRVTATASDHPSAHGLLPKGIFMRRRDLINSFITVGMLMSLFALAAISVGLPAPLERMGDAALAQYGGGSNNDDDDDNNDNNDGGEDAPPALRPPPLPAQAVAFARNDCGLLRQNFTGAGRGRAFGACVSAAALALQQPTLDPQIICGSKGLSARRQRGERRSDRDACVLAVSRLKTSYFVRQAG